MKYSFITTGFATLLVVLSLVHADVNGGDRIRKLLRKGPLRSTVISDEVTDLRSIRSVETSRSKGKIVGGTNSVYGKFPWQARIHNIISDAPHCGAVVINKDWLLSAAHCLKLPASSYQVVVGDYDLTTTDDCEQWFQIDKIILHEQYNPSPTTSDSDIALIKIAPNADGRGINFNKYVKPAKVANSETPFIVGAKCMISGWGSTNPDVRKRPNIMQAAEVSLMAQEDCESWWPGEITKRMFCISKTESTTCRGDSGGPLVCKVAGDDILFGITSFGSNVCGVLPSVFTRVSEFLPWIQFQIFMHNK